MTIAASSPPLPTAAALAARPLRLAVLAILVTAMVLWLPVHASLPLGRDHAIIGRVTLAMLDGGWPYVDAWDHKGPATYLLYAPAFLLFGRHEHAIVWMDMLVLAGVAAIGARIGRGLGQRGVGALAAVAAILTVRNDYWTFGQPDAWIGHLFVGVAALLVDPRLARRPATALAAGAAIGFATMVKPVYATMILLPVVAAVLQPRTQRRLPCLAMAAIGFAAIPLAFALAFVAGGHGAALWETYVLFNLGGHLTRTWDDMARIALSLAVNLVAPRFDFGLAVIVGVGAFGLAAIARRDRRAAVILGGGWLLALLAVIAQGKGFPYHFAAVHGFTGLFAAFLVAQRLEARLAGTTPPLAARRRAIAMGAIIGLAIVAALPHGQRVGEWWMARLGLLDAAEREQRLCQSDYCPWRLRALGEVIRRDTAPGEPIFVWGFDSAIYLHADRPAVSRFGFSYPLIGGPPEWRARARAELMAALASAPPRLVVVQDDDFIRLMHIRPSSDHLLDFPELAAFLAERYRLAQDLGRFLIYRRAP